MDSAPEKNLKVFSQEQMHLINQQQLNLALITDDF